MRIPDPDPSTRMFSILIMILLSLFAVSINTSDGQDCGDIEVNLDWSDVYWDFGTRRAVLHVPSEDQQYIVDVEFKVETGSLGSFEGFGVLSPYIDGDTIYHFGEGRDLGLMFDPHPDQGTSPVRVTLIFSAPVQCLQFEISDIDIAPGRKDSLIVTGNGGTVLPDLQVLSDQPTVRVMGSTAVALGGGYGRSASGSSFANQDDGTISVSFRDRELDSITIEYYEAGRAEDPDARGLGLFNNMSFFKTEIIPPKLVKFGLVPDEECMPVLRWVTSHELEIADYEIEYSFDGYNFSRVATVPAKNEYRNENIYEVLLERKLNAQNFFRLIRTDQSGNRVVLTDQRLEGGDCFSFTSINIYPNPSKGNYVFIEIETPASTTTDISIIDQDGEMLVQTKHSLKKGQNVFKLTSRHLVPGIYYVRFTAGKEIITKRINILK